MPRKRSEERRQQILDCAAKAFADSGYHATSVGDIVAGAGVARGTFYLYFQDKRSIFDELLQHFMSDLYEHIIRIDPSLSTEECLGLMRQNIGGAISVCLEQKSLTKILLSGAVGLDDDFDQKLLDFYAEVTRLMERSILLGQELGLVRPGETRIRATAAVGSVKELLYQLIMGRLDAPPEQVAEAMLEIYLHGIFVRS